MAAAVTPWLAPVTALLASLGPTAVKVEKCLHQEFESWSSEGSQREPFGHNLSYPSNARLKSGLENLFHKFVLRIAMGRTVSNSVPRAQDSVTWWLEGANVHLAKWEPGVSKKPIESCKKNERQKGKRDLCLKLQNFLVLNHIIHYFHNNNHNRRTLKFSEMTYKEPLLHRTHRWAKPMTLCLKRRVGCMSMLQELPWTPLDLTELQEKWDKTRKCTEPSYFQLCTRGYSMGDKQPRS